MPEEAVPEEAPEPAAESMPEIPVAEPDLSDEFADASVEADQVAPEEPGPGDSEGGPPAAPDEAEPQSE
jgi:hypothetical protein